MKALATKPTQAKQNASNTREVSQSHGELTIETFEPLAAEFVDNRSEAISQRKSQAQMDQSPQVQRLAQLQVMVNNSPHQVAQRKQLKRMFGPAIQRQSLEDEELLQGKMEPVQLQEEPEEEELLQGHFDPVQRQAAEDEDLLQGRFAGSEPPTQRQGVEDRSENRTGMPDPLKAGLEQLSGLDLSGVRVHRNSAKPSQLNALAYTKGQDIHVGPGQERHMPHEGWHVVQQMQGSVKPTFQTKGVVINDDADLEHEADVMGTKALQISRLDHLATSPAAQALTAVQPNIIQRAVGFEFEDGAWTSFQEVEKPIPTGEDEEKSEEEGPLYGERTFALGTVIDNEEGLRDGNVLKLLQMFPGLTQLREVLKFQTFAYSLDELKQSAASFLSARKKSWMGSTDEELSHNFFEAYKFLVQVMPEVFKVEPRDLDENAFELSDEVLRSLADALAVVVTSTLTPLSNIDMSPEELMELRLEFGGTNIYSTIEPPAHINDVVAQYGLEAAGKKGALHEEAGFKIEADGPYDKGRMDIEFVTDPFEESKAGLKRLKAVLKRIKIITQHLGRHSGKDYKKGEFVKPEDTRFSNPGAFLAGGRRSAAIKMQVTHGVPLSRISALMKTLGTDVEGETTKQGRNRAPARRMMRPEGKKNTDTRRLGRAPQLANNIVTILSGYFHDGTEKVSLSGFLSYLILYIMQLDIGDPEGIKLRLPLMSRFSFDILYNQIPESQQKWLSENIPLVDLLIEKEIRSIISEFTLDRPMINIRGIAIKFLRGGHQPFFDLMKTLTVEHWINGILANRADLLVASNMKTYLTEMGRDYSQYDKSISLYLRGHANASNLVGEVDDLAIMENREIMPKNSEPISMSETESIAVSYMRYMIKLSQSDKGREEDVAFPKVNL